jgi:dATP pyrophosphohydrolase
VVHGHIEPGETAVEAARREMREETGLEPVRLFNLSRVELFYLHRTDRVALVPAFAAFVSGSAEPVLGPEHDAAEWLSMAEARERVAWPRVARALEDIPKLVGTGSAGALADVLEI